MTYIDGGTNADWLKGLTWPFPTEVEAFLLAIEGGRRLDASALVAHFMTLPASASMPDHLRTALIAAGLLDGDATPAFAGRSLTRHLPGQHDQQDHGNWTDGMSSGGGPMSLGEPVTLGAVRPPEKPMRNEPPPDFKPYDVDHPPSWPDSDKYYVRPFKEQQKVDVLTGNTIIGSTTRHMSAEREDFVRLVTPEQVGSSRWALRRLDETGHSVDLLFNGTPDYPGDGRLAYDVMDRALKGIFAVTGTDHDEAMVQVQRAAAQEFGLPSGRIESFVGKDLWDPQSGTPDADRLVMQGMLRAQYNETQKMFAREGIKEIQLARGFRADRDIPLGQHDIDTNPVSSWSADYASAKTFGNGNVTTSTVRGAHGYVVHATVPVSRILSTAETGFGWSGGWEVVVLGGDPMAVTVESAGRRVKGIPPLSDEG